MVATIFLFLLIGLVLLVIYLIGAYNKLVALRNNRKQAFADIDVQLKQRSDLIPNLVSTVKGYAKHEKKLFDDVVKARERMLSASTIDDKIDADNQIGSALKNIFALSENYPELKANENFRQLQVELADVENKLASARRFFNNATKEFNTVLEMFPYVFLAPMFGFKSGRYFEASVEERKNVKVEF